MNIINTLSVGTLLLGLTMSTALASYTPTADDCKEEGNYANQVAKLTNQMNAAQAASQELYAQAQKDLAIAQENAQACAKLQKSSQTAQ